MGAMLSYSIVAGILLCVGYLVYKWVMAGEKQHAYNRAMLYMVYICALILPFAASGLPDFRRGAIAGAQAVPTVGVDLEGMAAGVIETPDVLPVILVWIYIAGMAALLVWSAAGMWNLLKVIRGAEATGETCLRDGRRVRILITPRRDVAPFSWLRYIVMNREDYETAGRLIITHEKRHLELCHWVDLLLAGAVLVIEWFNPAAWLLREEFMTVHEYQADDAVMRSGADCRQYQMLLIKKAVGTRFQSLANSLNHSKLKKRVTMMYQKKSSKMRRLGAMLLIPAMVAGVAAVRIPAVASMLKKASEVSLTGESSDKVSEKIADSRFSEMKIGVPAAAAPAATDVSGVKDAPAAVEQQKTVLDGGSIDEVTVVAYAAVAAPEAKPEEKVYVTAEKLPEYPGGMAAMMQFLAQNIRYPEEAMKSNTQGRVIVKFIVDKNGKVTSPEILRGVSPELDKEAIRVVEAMPTWTPGTVDGKPVRCWFSLPITYRLQGDDSDKTDGQTPGQKAEK